VTLRFRCARLVWPGLLALAVAASCGQTREPAAGLMLAVTSDGPLPIDLLEVRVESKDELLHDVDYHVPREAQLPTTLAIATNGDPRASVKITVVGWNGEVPLDRRDAIVTQVPTDRLAILPVVLSARCSNKVVVQDGEAVSTCGEGATCDPQTGDCTSAAVVGSTLASYSEGDEEQLGLGGSNNPGTAGAPGLPMAGESAGGAPTVPVGMGGESGQPQVEVGGAGGEASTPHQPGVCETSYRDCNEMAIDGCETDIDTNAAHCGACNLPCSNNHGDGYCEAGECQIDCTAGFEDCNDDRNDGCEADLTRDAGNCGTCFEPCLSNMGGTPWCREGSCGETVCPNADLGDCNGEPGDACETDLTAPEDCGACGKECSVTAGVAGCLAGECTVESCDGTLQDCVNGYADGCETDISQDEYHCGSCGKVCSTAPSAHVDDNQCLGGDCVPSCSGVYLDCDGKGENGCELPSDASNCGACNQACATTNASGTACSGGVCTPTCNAGWKDCSDPQDGCTTQLGTVTDCTDCGDECSGATPFCTAGGCSDHKDIVVENSGVRSIGGWTGSGGNSEITLQHTLTNPNGNARMILMGVVASDPLIPPVSVTYDARPMTLAAFAQDGTTQSFAGVYYLLDAALPATAGNKSVVVKFWNGVQWGHGGFDLLELKNVQQVAPIASGSNFGSNCPGTTIRSVTITFNQPGSLVYGLLSARGATSATLSAASGLIETWNQYQATPDKHVGAAARVFDNDNRTITWTVPTCYNTAQVAVAIKRLSFP
jgi:hypothetical protein